MPFLMFSLVALHYAHPAYARRPPTYEVADLNSNVRATTSSTSGAAPSSSAISATSSATSTPYLCSPPLSTDPNSSGAREFAAVAGDVKGERKCSFESMLVDDQLYHHQGAVAARRCSSSPQLKPLISPDYLEILRLEAMKASAEAQAKKAKREEMLAKIDLVKSLTAAGCTKEEIIKAIGPFVSPDTGSEQVSEKRHDKTASIVNNNDTQLTMEE